MNTAKRYTLDEVIADGERAKALTLVVEGISDKRFYEAWIRANLPNKKILVKKIEDVEVPFEELHALGLNDGNRDLVIGLAAMAQKRENSGDQLNLLCIADLDCGFGADVFSFESLLWTDFPALESYAFSEHVLEALNSVVLEDKLPLQEGLIDKLEQVFESLFRFRKTEEHIQAPDIAKCFSRPASIDSFDILRGIDGGLNGEYADGPILIYADPREVVYGHDLAKVLIVLFANLFKNTANIKDEAKLEQQLLLTLLSDLRLAELSLFMRLREASEPF